MDKKYRPEISGPKGRPIKPGMKPKPGAKPAPLGTAPKAPRRGNSTPAPMPKPKREKYENTSTAKGRADKMKAKIMKEFGYK